MNSTNSYKDKAKDSHKVKDYGNITAKIKQKFETQKYNLYRNCIILSLVKN